MWLHKSLPIALLILSICPSQREARYAPTWESLDARPLPAWYDESKIGIFMHWGVFSVPSYGSEWFWWNWQGAKNNDTMKFMEDNYPPGFTYPEFAPMFKAEFYDPNQWADIFNASGARYVVLTSKHHEGYCNWATNYSWNWNSVDVGPRRDLVGDLAKAIRTRTKIHFGLYHSMFEWFNPLYLKDKSAKFESSEFVQEKTMPELIELTNKYQPDVIWSDGDWEAPVWYWNSTLFLAWLYNDSPVRNTVVVNDRWGAGTGCMHGGFFSCQDRYNPGKLIKHKWENAMTVDKGSWGYRREAKLSDYMTINELLEQVVSTVSCGGNILINVGPTADGRIAPIFEERLREMGAWLDINGEAIYATKPWHYQNDTVTPGIWYTSSKKDNSTAYAILLNWPVIDKVFLGAVQASPSASSFELLGQTGKMMFDPSSGKGVLIHLPPHGTLSQKQPVYTIKMTGVAPVKF